MPKLPKPAGRGNKGSNQGPLGRWGGADTMPSSAVVDVTTTAPHLEPAIPAPPASGTPATVTALVLPVQPDNRVGVTRPDGVAGRLDEDFGSRKGARRCAGE
jgi:hypothetical protein